MLQNVPDEQLRLAAHLYYMDGLAQAEVAKMVKVSQAKVSRLLALARERGVVRISVAEYEPRNKDLERELCARLQLKAATVIKTVPGAVLDETRHAVGYFGASFAASLVPKNGVCATAGGRTMRELIQSWPANRDSAITVVQAMGSIDFTPGPVDAVELGRLLAQKCGGFFVALNTPAFVPDKRTRDSLMAHEQIRGVWQRLSQADVAFVGIGTPANSIFVDRGVLKPDDLSSLKSYGAVGEICGRFYNQSGQECASPWSERVISIELQTLRHIPEVIGVVAGSDRSEAIIAAVRGNLLKSLVIDEQGALSLLRTATAGIA
jgi:DNA-binding transcriptional regulator LsrR (DeoR family)